MKPLLAMASWEFVVAFFRYFVAAYRFLIKKLLWINKQGIQQFKYKVQIAVKKFMNQNE